MEIPTLPLLTLYVVWHPLNAKGGKVADLLLRHFGRDRHRNITGDPGLSVIYRSEIAPNALVPLSIDWDDTEATAVVVLVDSVIAGDTTWSNYVLKLVKDTQAKGLFARLFPVMMESKGLDLQLEVQALRWDCWEGSDADREQRLVRDLTYELIRMLRRRLFHDRSKESEALLTDYLEKVQVFISHSKHDNDGEPVARSIRDWLHTHSALSSFFDVYDLPAGLSSNKVLLHQVKNSAVVAVHTDSYSSREWCRREVIEAKRHHVPMIVVDCLRDLDERSIPYMGNVPIIRMNPARMDRIEHVAGCLLDEVFKDFLWRCRIERLRSTNPNVLFMARPPELISLATLPTRRNGASTTIVYPEPSLGADEARLFLEIAPDVRTQTMMEWLENTQ